MRTGFAFTPRAVVQLVFDVYSPVIRIAPRSIFNIGTDVYSPMYTLTAPRAVVGWVATAIP